MRRARAVLKHRPNLDSMKMVTQEKVFAEKSRNSHEVVFSVVLILRLSSGENQSSQDMVRKCMSLGFSHSLCYSLEVVEIEGENRRADL